MPDKPPKAVKITIDEQIFNVPKEEVSAEELRALPEPDIGSDRDLYLEGRGIHEDDLIAAGETVKLKNNLHFFTAPASITPGLAS